MANGNIPTGTAPLFLGNFASQQSAMAERLTQEMIRQAQQEKTQSARDRAAMLKALSFETVRGLGRKVQDELITEIDQLRDDFSKRWIDNGRKLTDRDYIDLERRKHEVDQKISNMKYNVALYGKYADEIRKNSSLFHEETVRNMEKYAKEGDIGKPVLPLIKYMPDIEGVLKNYIDDVESNVPIVETREWDGDVIAKSEGRPREKIMEYIVPKLQKDPKWQSLMQSDDYIREKAIEAVEEWVGERSGMTLRQEPPTEADIKKRDIKGLPPEYQEMVKKHNLDITDKENLDWVKSQNDIGERFLMRDRYVFDRAVGLPMPGGGTIKDIWVDGDGTIFVNNSKENMPSISFKVNDWNDENEVVEQKARAASLLKGIIRGEYFNGASSYIFPTREAEVENSVQPSDLTLAESILNVAQSDVGKGTVTINKDKEDEKELTLMSIQHRKYLADEMSKIFPDDSFKAERGGTWSGDRPFYWTPKGGKKMEFDLNKESERKRLLDEIRKRMPAASSQSTSGTTQTSTTEPVEDPFDF